MGEIENIKTTLTGEPVPYHSTTEQACEICAGINETVRRYDVPEPRDQELESGDKVIFFVSRKDDEGSTYVLSRGVNHYHHHDEYDYDFDLGSGIRGKHNALVIAVVEQTGYDFGKQMAEIAEIEYKPDVEEDALTLAQVDVMLYSSPQWGDPESEAVEIKEPDESDYATPLKLNPTWPAELQKAVYNYIQKNQ